MPKYRKALYISFMGEYQYAAHRKSYAFQPNFNSEHNYNYSINPYTQRPRKQLFTNTMPFVRINFPFTMDDTYRRGVNLMTSLMEHIDPSKKFLNTFSADMLYNKGEAWIIQECQKLERNSIIYIDAHGSPTSESLLQKIRYVTQEAETFDIDIPYSTLGDILDKGFPKHISHIHIKILACEPIKFSECLMNYFHQKGYKKFAVTCYKSTSSDIGPIIPCRGNHIEIKDNSTSDRRHFLKYKHGLNYNDNKITHHNYEGVVEKLAYRVFKERYLKVAHTRANNEVSEIGPEKEELIFFQNLLYQSLSDYIDRYRTSTWPFNTSHQKSGYNRAIFFCKKINSISHETIISTRNIENIMKYFIKEIYLFATKGAEYRQFGGKINLNNHSAMTYILKALNEFYNPQLTTISPCLKTFINIVCSNSIQQSLFRLQGLIERQIDGW